MEMKSAGKQFSPLKVEFSLSKNLLVILVTARNQEILSPQMSSEAQSTQPELLARFLEFTAHFICHRVAACFDFSGNEVELRTV